ncbi:replication initiator protein [Capybara microvirus Cap1_SP_83]|nr:replication initiator protein [Capybara microvirus Cap1_SP_83]
MCSSPITIRNPNYAFSRDSTGNIKPLIFHDSNIRHVADSSPYMQVPCGHCPDCVARKSSDLAQRASIESLYSHVFFLTLTYNNDSLPHFLTSEGGNIPFADFSDLQKMFKLIRKYNEILRPFKYVSVSERGTEGARPHFHVLLFVEKLPKDDYNDILNLESYLSSLFLRRWQRNYGSTRNPDYRNLCTFVDKSTLFRKQTNFDLHYVKPDVNNGISSVVYYCMKYMLKESSHDSKLHYALKSSLPPGEAAQSWSVVRSKRACSLDFGRKSDPSVLKRIHDDVDKCRYLYNTPVFCYPDCALTAPLSRYYYDALSLDQVQYYNDLYQSLPPSSSLDYDSRLLKDSDKFRRLKTDVFSENVNIYENIL